MSINPVKCLNMKVDMMSKMLNLGPNKEKFSGMHMLLILSLYCLSACMDQAGRKGKPTIEDFTKTTATEQTDCTDFISTDLTSCLQACASDQHIASSVEIDTSLSTLKSTIGITAEKEADLRALIAGSKGLCIQDVTRPNEQVFIKSDYCACKDTIPLIRNNCLGYCASKNTGTQELLFVNVTLGAAIELNTELGSLKNWCTKEIGDGQVQPSCSLELTSDAGTQLFDIKAADIGKKNFTVDIKSVSKDVTFVARIVENKSGAGSNTFQFRKFTYVPDPGPAQGPLKIMPTNQYSCITRAGQATPDGFDFTQALRLHYYFPAKQDPPTLPPLNSAVVFCHDINAWGINDSPLFPRLELVPQSFALWDDLDSRFVDSDGNSKEDISDTLQARLLAEYGVTRNLKIFFPFRWPNVINVGSGSGSSSSVSPMQGFIMQPWVSSVTGRGFCPTQENYNGSDPLFRVMKEAVGVDTEGLYFAQREPLVLSDSQGNLSQAPTDILLIREGLLKKIWFYYENGKHYVPDEISAGQKTIMLYWPADEVNPYIRKSTQNIYIVKRFEEIAGGSAATGSGLATSVQPPDKRFGCIPALGY